MAGGFAAFFWGLMKLFQGDPVKVPGGNVTIGKPRVVLSTPAVRPALVAPQALEGGRVQQTQQTGRLSFEQAKGLAVSVTSRYFQNVDPKMLVAMIQIESSFNPRAVRFEANIRNRYTPNGDSSYGLMQTLWSTALWLYQDMGATAFSVATAQRLFDPTVSVYFGAAYVNWLLRWKGVARSEDWIVMSYNGGPGADNSQTRNHLRKYHEAKASQAGGW